MPKVTAVDIMSKWTELKTGGSTDKPSSNDSNPPMFQSSALAGPVTRKEDERSLAESSASIESYSFSGGMDVVHVLRIMTDLEDQLSFFADKVKEYFRKAEEMDLRKHNSSLTLLTDDDFVVMLYQIRDRFMALVRN